jgi:glycerol-3-phosphate O-acyltransferase
MANSSTFKQRLEQLDLPARIKERMLIFFQEYQQAVEKDCTPWFKEYLDLVYHECQQPFVFQPYHEKIRTPYDYYTFGLKFLAPLVDRADSCIEGRRYIDEIVSHVKAGHNVILFANHQIEADPQAISILLDDDYPRFAEEMIFVAGERVTTDPLAIPFSMGRNLLCIYSKRYIDHPPEKKGEKQHHNKKTMELMSLLLKQGGKCIYIAPSGGRDRASPEGIVEVAPFDPQSIEMCNLMAKKAGHPTFFYPMALATYHLLPPPQTIQIELGEERKTQRGPIHMAVGPAIDMDHFPGYDLNNKHDRRKARAEYIWEQVCADYKKISEKK